MVSWLSRRLVTVHRMNRLEGFNAIMGKGNDRGIYILANDAVLDQCITVVKSIRKHDPDTPMALIPYNEACHHTKRVLADDFLIDVNAMGPISDRVLTILREVSDKIFFRDGLFNRPNLLRKLACWFGPFERFLYLDTDIVVFRKIADIMDHLDDVDFICCDYQANNGIRGFLSEDAIRIGFMDRLRMNRIFNAGFFGSKSEALSWKRLHGFLTEVSSYIRYFDFSTGCCDMPVFNSLVASKIAPILTFRNLTYLSGFRAGSWAGSPHFIQEGDHLLDPRVGEPLVYLHWAGIPIRPDCPYWSIWKGFQESESKHQ